LKRPNARHQRLITSEREVLQLRWSRLLQAA
jgi:hypothetical protein